MRCDRYLDIGHKDHQTELAHREAPYLKYRIELK